MTSRSRKYRESPQSDEELMSQFCATHEDAFLEQLINRYEYDLYHYLKRFLGDSQLAEDVFQAKFLKFSEKVPICMWAEISSVAVHGCNEPGDWYAAANKRHRGISLEKNITTANTELDGISLLEILPGKEKSPEELLQKEERAEQIQNYINSLSPPLRQVILLIYYEGIKYREVAEILNIPVGTVKSRLHTAMKKLGLLLRGIEDL